MIRILIYHPFQYLTPLQYTTRINTLLLLQINNNKKTIQFFYRKYQKSHNNNNQQYRCDNKPQLIKNNPKTYRLRAHPIQSQINKSTINVCSFFYFSSFYIFPASITPQEICKKLREKTDI